MNDDFQGATQLPGVAAKAAVCLGVLFDLRLTQTHSALHGHAVWHPKFSALKSYMRPAIRSCEFVLDPPYQPTHGAMRYSSDGVVSSPVMRRICVGSNEMPIGMVGPVPVTSESKIGRAHV